MTVIVIDVCIYIFVAHVSVEFWKEWVRNFEHRINWANYINFTEQILVAALDEIRENYNLVVAFILVGPTF